MINITAKKVGFTSGFKVAVFLDADNKSSGQYFASAYRVSEDAISQIEIDGQYIVTKINDELVVVSLKEARENNLKEIPLIIVDHSYNEWREF